LAEAHQYTKRDCEYHRRTKKSDGAVYNQAEEDLKNRMELDKWEEDEEVWSLLVMNNCIET